jgi:hypothetical protein
MTEAGSVDERNMVVVASVGVEAGVGAGVGERANVCVHERARARTCGYMCADKGASFICRCACGGMCT